MHRRRRWRRERAEFTVLGRFAGGDRLGRTVNLSERGLGAVFQGRGYAVAQAVEIQLVVDGAVSRTFGVVCSAVPRGSHTRVGIRTFGYIPSEEGAAQTWAGCRRGAARPDHAPGDSVSSKAGPGAWLAPVSPGGLRAIERDRRELAGDLRAHHGARRDEAWEEVLRRFLHQLAGSPLRGRFVREQFRAAMSTRYPVAGGTEIHGRVLLHGSVLEARELPPCIIHLDHFPVARADTSGEFVARGIPTLDDVVSVPLRIANQAVLSISPVAVHLPRLTTARIDVELAIVLRPATIGKPPVPGAEQTASCPDLGDLRRLVDQL